MDIEKSLIDEIIYYVEQVCDGDNELYPTWYYELEGIVKDYETLKNS